jgi:DnaJ domain
MFDRRKSDRAEGAGCAEVTLANGRELKGKFNLPPGRTLAETLNGGSNFMEFEPFGGDLVLIAKSAVQAVKPINVPSAPNLSAGVRETDAFDPYAILRINRDAGAEDVRKAFLDLAKTYHPDKYTTVDLPTEVRAYLSAMARRVNAAHDAVQETLKARAARQAPVFTKAS